MNNIEFKVRHETEVARFLVADLKTYFGDDAPLLATAVEGETSLFEAIDAVIAEIDEVDVLVTGLREKEAQFTARRRAMEERIRRLRALIEQAMATLEQHSIRRPTATLSLRRMPPDVVVVSEADIPSEFFFPQPPPPPKLDKGSLRAALNECARRLEEAASIDDAVAREEALNAIPAIPGALLSNGGFSLQIREVLMLQNLSRPGGLRPHQLELLRRTIAADCLAAEFDLFVETAERYGLDPFRRQIMPLIIGKHQPAKRRMVIIVGIEGQRIIAQRCGNYRPAGEPTKISTSPKLKGPTNPQGITSARVKLWQQDNRGDWFPVMGEAHWDEFAPIKEEWEEDKETQQKEPTGRLVLDAKWVRMPRLMIAKCANMQALRAGWPEQFGGLYAEEEMDRARTLDLAASEIVEQEQERARLRAAAGKDAITVSWGDWALENVPTEDFAKRVIEWMNASGRQAAEIVEWRETNREALRLFWNAAPNEALDLKKAIETQIPIAAADGA